ncbi:hypothetical protein A7Q26_02150 [Sphingobium sp. TCM1]|nr:hypothetical protein A7Q26_02150 [Sphingobium sp. TCM1]
MGDDDTLLAQAFDIFTQWGYEATSLRDMARRMGVSHNLLPLRFGTKAEMWKRAVDLRVGQSSAASFAVLAQVDLPPQERIVKLIRTYCDTAAAHPEVTRLFAIEGIHESWRLDHLVGTFVEPFRRELEALLQALARDGSKPVSAIAFMSLLVNGVGTYYAARPLAERLDTPAEGQENIRDRFVAVLVKAATG